MHRLTNKQLGILGAILIIVLLLGMLLFHSPSQQENTTAARSQTPLTQTTPSQATIQQLKEVPTFQYLVSYTDRGFEPSTVKIKKGDTVRFTNNSSGQLWIASVGKGSAAIYPGSSDCGASSFDSCGALAPGAFWQFTFSQAGTYYFQNNVDSTKSGEIIITVR